MPPEISAPARQRLSYPVTLPVYSSGLNRLLLPVLAAVLVSPAFASDKTAKSDQPALAGGYSSTEIDSEARKVVGFAVKTRAQATGSPLRLVKILKVERQVVAGLNYRLDLKLTDGSKHLKAHAVVWKKLDGSLTLTSWE